MGISDNYDMFCFDLCLENIFEKFTKAERCTYVMFKLTLHVYLYCKKIKIYNEDIDMKI